MSSTEVQRDLILGCIGGGNMAEAIIRSAVSSGVVPAARLIVSEPNPDRAAAFESIGVAFTTNNAEVVARSQQILLAVKPQIFPLLADDLGQTGADQIAVSIMAGITSDAIATAMAGGDDVSEKGGRVVRVMPNTPVMIGRGMAGIALGKSARTGDDALALALFSAGNNEAVAVPESLMDAITAVSGSGPAYLFYLAQAMEQAARDMGLGEASRLLVAQTLHGAAELFAGSTETADELRRRVTSPNGTTHAACSHLDEQGVMAAMVNAVKAAEARGKELGGTK